MVIDSLDASLCIFVCVHFAIAETLTSAEVDFSLLVFKFYRCVFLKQRNFNLHVRRKYCGLRADVTLTELANGELRPRVRFLRTAVAEPSTMSLLRPSARSQEHNYYAFCTCVAHSDGLSSTVESWHSRGQRGDSTVPTTLRRNRPFT